MVIIFSHPKVRNYLLENGVVYTFRADHQDTEDGVRLQVGNDWAAARRGGGKIVDVTVSPVERMEGGLSAKVLGKYVGRSGFETVVEWMEAIMGLWRKAVPPHGWIYRVDVRESKGGRE